jgi:hypothetical protein
MQTPPLALGHTTGNVAVGIKPGGIVLNRCPL